MSKNIFEYEFAAYSLTEKNELVLYLKFYMKRKLRKPNVTDETVSKLLIGLSQLGDFENMLIDKFKKKGLKYIRIDNSKTMTMLKINILNFLYDGGKNENFTNCHRQHISL